MPSSDHILFFLLSAVLHVLGLLLIGMESGRIEKQGKTAPVLEVTSVELDLASIDPTTPSDADTPSEGTAGQQPAGTPLAPLEMPIAQENPPPPPMPEKPDFTAALTPPPEPVSPPPAPLPAPAPAPLPAAAATPLPTPAPKPATPASAPIRQASAPKSRTDSRPLPATSAAGTGDKAEIRPANGGGGAAGRIDAHPSLHRPIKPNYPIGARRRGEEGTVILDVTVASDGSAKAVSRVSTSGFPELDDAAERAAERARFKPGTRNGKPIESSARITIIFRLRDA